MDNSATQHHTLIVIAGPTAVGKTSVAIELAQQLRTKIISADSRQCYQGMVIGTAQPTVQERSLVPHYFVDCFSPELPLSAADFERLSLGYLDEIFKESAYAVVCGGTGLYIKALCEGLDEMPPVDTHIAAQVNALYLEKGISWLKDMLQHEDPIFFASGDIENPARMIRALAFVRSAGSSITRYRSGTAKQRPFRIVKIALDMPREKLYERINKRVDQMMASGLLEEVQSLLPQRSLKNLNTVGYAELFQYLEGILSLDDAVEKIKQHSRNYAKRQLTWFKKQPDFHWLSATANDLQIQIKKLI